MANQTPAGEISDDYSAESTLIIFPKPIPLLRGPVPAAPTDNPSLGPFVLAFPNPRAFTTVLTATRSKLLEQCHAGVRIGCSITASNKCTPPWWAHLLGWNQPGFKERAECEEREMAACLVGASEKCENFAEEKCSDPFGSARVWVGKDSRWGLEFGLAGRDPGLGYVKGGEILKGGAMG